MMTRRNITILIICSVVSALGGALAARSCSRQGQQSQAAAADPVAPIVTSIQGTDRLYTTEYIVHKAVKYDDVVNIHGSVLNHEFTITPPQGKRKIIIPMDAVIKAYIDFSGFTADNVSVAADSSRVVITLPDPVVELTSTRIDHGGIREYVDFGRSSFSQAEMSEFERQGRAAVIEAIPTMGIIDDARVHAANILRPMIAAMGYAPEAIVIEFGRRYTARDYGEIIHIDTSKP